MKVSEDNFVVLQGWMLAEEYDLSARELIILGLINGFSQDGESKYQGNLAYIQEWSRSKSRTTAIETLKSLEGKGLIVKESELINGVLFNRYRAICRGSSKIEQVVQKLNKGSSKIEHNNNIDNNISLFNTPSIKNSLDNSLKKGEKEKLFEVLLGDIERIQFALLHAELIERREYTEEEIRGIAIPYIEEFWANQVLNCKDNISGRSIADVRANFNNWLIRNKKKEKDGVNKKDNRQSGFDDESIADMLRLD